jgi:hypothetical protein
LFKRCQIVERDRGASRQQRLEAGAEIRIVGQRQRAIGQPVEGVGAVHDAGPAGSAAGELDRGLDAFGAGVGKEHLVQIRYVIEQPFRKHTGQRRYVELHEIGQVAVQHALQGLAQRRMVPANRKNAKTAQ